MSAQQFSIHSNFGVRPVRISVLSTCPFCRSCCGRWSGRRVGGFAGKDNLRYPLTGHVVHRAPRHLSGQVLSRPAHKSASPLPNDVVHLHMPSAYILSLALGAARMILSTLNSNSAASLALLTTAFFNLNASTTPNSLISAIPPPGRIKSSPLLDIPE